MRPTLALAVALLVVLAGCGQAPDGATTTEPTEVPTTTGLTTEPAAATTGAEQAVVEPADPSSDVLGWEDGYWFNETIAVDSTDGLNDSEMDAVVSRAMARVEEIRGLEFDERVPVTIVTRSEFRREQANRSLAGERALFDNVKFEALFMIGESTDSLAVQNRNSGTAIGGYYSPEDDEIVVVSENETAPKLDEITLAQELYHALQDQRFNISSFNQSTRELHNARDGLIEGDGNYVDYLYERRCRTEWAGDCLSGGTANNSSSLANIGPYILKFQPYSDGPAFVRLIRETHEREGWAAVNDLYENPPASTEQVIHPEKYSDDSPAEFGIADRSTDEWQRLRLDERPSYASVGEAGLFSMFMYPAYASRGRTAIVPPEQFLNRNESTGELRTIDPLNYNSTYSAGWDGDRLVVYTNEETPPNETAYVWKSVWDSEADAEEFVEGYEQVLAFHNATAVEGRRNTWVIPAGSAFDDAFYVRQNGSTVVVVNAPTVEDLPAVRRGAAPES